MAACGQNSKPSAPKSDSSAGPSSSSGSKPSAPEAGSRTGGSSPSRPKSPALAPPKAPTLPKLPKLPKPPKSGWKPPKGSLPGSTPGQPPYHGSGGHLPGIGGGHSHDHDDASLARSCIHPKGMDRLRCEKPDAIVGAIFAIIGLLLAPFLLYLCIMYCKRKRSTRKNRNEEDGMELTSGVTNCHPGPPTNREVSDGASNIGLAVTTTEESFTLAKVHTQDRSFGSNPEGMPPPVYQPPTRSVSPGRKTSGYAHSTSSVRSSLSSGMIRSARLGIALQDATVIDVPPSSAGSRKDSDPCYSSNDVKTSPIGSHWGSEEQHFSEDKGRDYGDSGVESGEIYEEAERRSGSRCSSHSSRSSHTSDDEPGEEHGTPDDAISSQSRPPSTCDQQEDGYVTADSERCSVG